MTVVKSAPPHSGPVVAAEEPRHPATSSPASVVNTRSADDEVAGWRGYSAATAGTEYGGANFTTVTYSNPGTFTLLAASTSIDHNAA